MLEINEYIPFTFGETESASMDSSKLNDAYQELVKEFPELYSILIVSDAQLVYEKYNAPASEKSAFSIKSITKSIMNALIGIAIREGLIQSVC